MPEQRTIMYGWVLLDDRDQPVRGFAGRVTVHVEPEDATDRLGAMRGNPDLSALAGRRIQAVELRTAGPDRANPQSAIRNPQSSAPSPTKPFDA